MPETGDLVGPYRLIVQLGKGAMGEVWRARDERLDRYVALKIMPKELERDVERRTRMLREARAAAAIKHAAVVTLFDIVKHADDDVLVMELVEGRTLSDTLRKDGPPDLATGLAWIAETADALVAAHARGILHRDIKAANIMVTEAGGVKVLDFGLAKLATDQPLVMPAQAERAPPTVSQQRVALDATMPSEPLVATKDLDAYRTHAGQLIGTPLYMAPEQITGGMPDVRSEVFSVGVVAYEILSGKSPYSATTITELFEQIEKDVPAPLEHAPASIAAIVMKALAKVPDDRHQTMTELRDAIAAERARLFDRPRGKLLAVAGVAAILLTAAIVIWQVSRAPIATPPEPERPGDKYVKRAVEEYDLFYGEKAIASLRAAVATVPDHARANAYLILFEGSTDVTAAKRVIGAATGRDRALLAGAIALIEHGPRAGREALGDTTADRELQFWAAELAYRARDYVDAQAGFKPLSTDPKFHFRGRIFDHYSSVALYLDDPAEAVRIGKAYRDAFPGEADAVGVHATTLAAAGQFPEAIAAAEAALALNEGEDTLAGLGKVVALAGDRKRARDLYQRSLDRAPPARKPLRRAALALLQWIDGDPAAATTVAPCFPGGTDAGARERGACLFVGAIVDPPRATEAASQLDALASAATDTKPAYGAPAALATLVRASTTYLGGGCVHPPTGTPDAKLAADLAKLPVDFYAAYHVPFFATWIPCERAAILAATGDVAGARALLEPIAKRAPNRTWIESTVSKLP